MVNAVRSKELTVFSFTQCQNKRILPIRNLMAIKPSENP